MCSAKALHLFGKLRVKLHTWAMHNAYFVLQACGYPSMNNEHVLRYLYCWVCESSIQQQFLNEQLFKMLSMLYDIFCRHKHAFVMALQGCLRTN